MGRSVNVFYMMTVLLGMAGIARTAQAELSCETNFAVGRLCKTLDALNTYYRAKCKGDLCFGAWRQMESYLIEVSDIYFHQLPYGEKLSFDVGRRANTAMMLMCRYRYTTEGMLARSYALDLHNAQVQAKPVLVAIQKDAKYPVRWNCKLEFRDW